MLQFKDIKQNSNVYILDKNTVEITTGKISSASFPKLEYNPQTGQQQMMITFGIEADGKSPTYSIPESASVVTAGDLIIATEKAGLLHDIGRFEQLKRYQSFIDSQTIDHANLGVTILFDDNLIEKIKPIIAKILCIVLLIIFSFDAVYSHFYPNTGEGITDYQ